MAKARELLQKAKMVEQEADRVERSITNEGNVPRDTETGPDDKELLTQFSSLEAHVASIVDSDDKDNASKGEMLHKSKGEAVVAVDSIEPSQLDSLDRQNPEMSREGDATTIFDETAGLNMNEEIERLREMAKEEHFRSTAFRRAGNMSAGRDLLRSAKLYEERAALLIDKMNRQVAGVEVRDPDKSARIENISVVENHVSVMGETSETSGQDHSSNVEVYEGNAPSESHFDFLSWEGSSDLRTSNENAQQGHVTSTTCTKRKATQESATQSPLLDYEEPVVDPLASDSRCTISTEVEVLRLQAKQAKLRAVQLKRAGQITEARAVLGEAKLLEEKISVAECASHSLI
eukprot:CAMPEP_0196591482 /NCGR_PEP_ID=MMETSP1081-20130531/69770_1 /TAXON_ID=36882 /ORGANISM="Pyramimonas amylifera, Strain CCMP720" /LENGTH=347 /DNA_ID=CAMNT_0041914851 /DNA_START=8 /DNA_END=1051 /DNA_ORIENTATION=-